MIVLENDNKIENDHFKQWWVDFINKIYSNGLTMINIESLKEKNRLIMDYKEFLKDY